jgi:protein TonB
VIAQEHLATDLTASTTTGHKTMSSYARTEGSLVPQRTTALILIVGIHVALVLAFASGIGRNVIPAIPSIMKIVPLADPARVVPQPPPLTGGPTFTHPKWTIPEPPPWVEFKGDEIPTEKGVDTGPIIAPPLPPSVKRIDRVVGGVGKGFPNTEDYYPPSAIRAGETGTTAIQVCVNTAGRLTSLPTLTGSSGSIRLDEGALKLAKAGSGHYRPTTEDGRPVDSCYGLLVTFKVRD